MKVIEINENQTLIFDNSDIISNRKDIPIENLTIFDFKYQEGVRKAHTAYNIMYISDNGEMLILKARMPVHSVYLR